LGGGLLLLLCFDPCCASLHADLSGPLTPQEVAQNRERFLTVLSDMTGHHVKVALVDGTTFKAIFHTVKDLKKKI
jgi:hypothetical protein